MKNIIAVSDYVTSYVELFLLARFCFWVDFVNAGSSSCDPENIFHHDHSAHTHSLAHAHLPIIYTIFTSRAHVRRALALVHARANV